MTGSVARNSEIGTLLAGTTAVSWTGRIGHTTRPKLTFAITANAPGEQAIINQTQVSDGQQLVTESVTTIVNGIEMYLPQIQRH